MKKERKKTTDCFYHVTYTLRLNIHSVSECQAEDSL